MYLKKLVSLKYLSSSTVFEPVWEDLALAVKSVNATPEGPMMEVFYYTSTHQENILGI